MAGAGYKLFNTGDVLTAAQVNTYLQEQTVMVFASSTARTTALSGVLAEGMMSYLQDTNAVEVYNGTSWVNVGNAGDITEVQAGVGISIASGTGPIPVITNSSTDLITTAGDLLYGTAADTMARLGIGTAGQVLKVNSGATAPEWGAASAAGFKGCRLTFSSGVTVANATNVTVNWDVETFDTDGFHSTVSNTSRITIPAGLGGKYLVVAKGLLENAAEGLSIIRLYKNGAQVFTIDMYKWNGGYTHTTLTDIISLVATDYLEIVWYQNTGASGTLQAGQTTSFGVQFLGA